MLQRQAGGPLDVANITRLVRVLTAEDVDSLGAREGKTVPLVIIRVLLLCRLNLFEEDLQVICEVAR
jgi:hypothetical protein